ncbi:hypothetical protein Acr_00g0067580 [Actinidia rufa]|uniref:Transmembrane protein n=1 Tax=Actinidia rufa TaxID=165716 RepID=A0A7J0DQZ0_9ERIC|nr:hypothetical protein Acr_00g0067580 [Actinidia rufa]
MENPNCLRRGASWLSKLKSSALQLLPFISNTPDDESTEVDLEASSQSSTLQRSLDPNELICECEAGQQQLSNPIAQAFREVELGKAFLTMIMPIATVLLAVPNRESSPLLLQSTLCLISAALVLLFYGNSLRNMFPKTANALEQLGTTCINASFFTTVGSYLAPPLVWFPIGCFILCVILSIFSCIRLEKKKCPYCNRVLKRY